MSNDSRNTPSLQVRSLPLHIYELLAKQAKAEHRSLAQQAIIVLAKGLNLEVDPTERRKTLVNRISSRDEFKLNADLDLLQLIREDRDR